MLSPLQTIFIIKLGLEREVLFFFLQMLNLFNSKQEVTALVAKAKTVFLSNKLITSNLGYNFSLTIVKVFLSGACASYDPV